MKAGGGPVADTRRSTMKQYLLSMYQPQGRIPSPEELAPVMRDLGALREEMQAVGAWVFGAGLHAPETATVVRNRGGEVLTTDGPFVEGKEYLGGFTIIKAPDLDAALEWARRMAVAVTLQGAPEGLPIEVRPFQGELED
jgi:hypothetical protein